MNAKRQVEGGCLCGQFRFRCEVDENMRAAHCSCRDCQHSTGAAVSTCVVIPGAQFTVLQGETASHSVQGDSGGEVQRNFCPQCGSPLYGCSNGSMEYVFVWAPCFDEDDWIHPQMHVWTDSHPPWGHPFGEGIRTFANQDPPPKSAS